MNVCYLISTLERTGPTNVLFDLVAGLDRTRFNPSIITLSPEPARSRLAEFTGLGIPVHTLDMGRLSGLFRATAAVRATLQSHHVDVCHSHGLRADRIAASLARLQPTCSTVHAVLSEDYRLGYGKYKGALVGFLHGQALKRIGNAVGCSSAVHRYLKNRLQLPDALCVKNGVATGRFKPDAEARSKVRSALGIGEGDTVWIATGALIPRKNPEWLIDTWAGEYGQTPNTRLLVLGNGPLYEACARKAQLYKNITLVGNVDNVPDYLSASDIFVSCSEAEGLPLAVLEAVASGLRCVISDIEPHREIADNAPPGVSTFTAGSIHSFVDAARAERLYPAGASVALRDFVCSEFSAAAMVRQYENIYQRLRK
jgi:glycosyltransferase involved in cell wall biosynthesis